MDLKKLLALLKPKPKPRPIYVGDVIVGWDDGLPNSVKMDRDKLVSALIARPLDKVHFETLLGSGYADWHHNLYTKATFADKGLYGEYGCCAGVSTGGAYMQIRSRRPKWAGNEATYYFTEIGVARTTTDHALWKSVAGTNTTLGQEAVDLTADGITQPLLSAVGTTIKSGRVDGKPYFDDSIVCLGTPIVVTDTSIASGTVGIGAWWCRYGSFTSGVSYWPSGWVNLGWMIVRDEAAGSPYPSAPEPLAYFEVPIEFFDLPEVNEDGTINITRQFYGIKMPEEIAVIEKPVPENVRKKKEILERKGWSEEEIRAFLPEAFPVEKINRLAVTWSALIPSDSSGKPVHGTALV